MRIYVGNLTYGSKPSELDAFLAEKGVNVLNLTWPRDGNGMRPFCFIDIPDENGDKIIQELHGQTFCGRPLKVSNAHPRRTV